MKRLLVVSVCFLVLFGLTTSLGLAWGSATHSYITDLLKRKGGPQNIAEIYGAVAPDVFNYVFGEPALAQALYGLTHDGFLSVWKAVKYGWEKPTAYGFVSHNDVWGADSTAHHHGLTYGQADGYVVAKAEMLIGILGYYDVWSGLGLDPVTDHALCLEICHNLVEAAVDILIKQVDPKIGDKMVAAAQQPNKTILGLLEKAYLPAITGLVGSEEMAKYVIAVNEQGFRMMGVLSLGQALRLGTLEETVGAVAEQLAGLAGPAFGLDVEASLVAQLLLVAMELCAPDCFTEVNATVDFVHAQLKAHKIN